MTEDRFLAEGEDGGQPPTVNAQFRPADCENSPMKRVKPVGPHSRSDLAVGKAEGIELAQRHHAVLLRSQPRKPAAGVRDALFGHITDNASSARIRPPDSRRTKRE